MSGTIGITINVSAQNSAQVFNAILNSIQGLDNSLKQATASAAAFSAQMNSMASGVGAVGTAAQGAAQGLNSARTASTGLMREIMVIGHEAMSGRFSRIPGSLMVLSEYMGSASIATMGLVGAFALAGIGAAHLVEWFARIKEAKAGAEASGAAFNPQIDQSALDAQVDSLRKMTDISTEDAGKIVNVYAGMRGQTTETLQAMATVTQSYAKATGESLDGAAKSIREVMENPSSRGAEFLATFHNSADAIKNFDTALSNNSPAQQRIVILNELVAADERVRKTQENKPADQSQVSGVSDKSGRQYIQHLDDNNKIIEQQLEERKGIMIRAFATMSNEEKLPQTEQVTWFQKQQEGADELREKIMGTGSSFKAANAASLSALADYWQKAEGLALAGSKDQLRAHEAYLRAKEELDVANLHVGDAAAKTAFQMQLEALSAQQAAAQGDLAAQVSIEQQKINLFISADKTHTLAYEEELRKQAELKARYAQQEVADTMSAINQEVAANERTYSEKVKTLNAQMQAGQISRDQEIQQLRELAESQNALEAQKLDTLISTLDQGTEAYRKAIAERQKLAQDLALVEQNLNNQALSNATKSAQGQMKVFEGAFDEIASSGESNFKSLISGGETWQKAEARMAGDVVSAFADAGLKLVASWLATELAKTATTEAQNAVRNAQTAGGTGLSALFSATIGQWLGMETTKTAITTQQVGLQTVTTTTGAAAQTAATTTGQTAQTAAVVVGGQARVIATTSAAAESRAAQAAINGPSVLADAAKAASGTYASVASIPYVGWILAPAAAGAAFAAVAAYESLASFATGSMELPHDMIAQVHKGEMIVPASAASQLRASMSAGYGVPGLNTGFQTPSPSQTAAHYAQTNNPSVTQSFTFNGGPGGSFARDASTLMSKARTDAMSMLWEISRNGSLTPRQI